MTHDGRAVCPNCGRLASRLAAMEEPGGSADGAPDAPPPTEAAPPPPPPAPTPARKPAPPAATAPTAKPAAAKPAAAKAAGPSAARPPRDRDAPLPPGIAWPSPEPLPPDDDGRPWWKIAVPAAAVVLILVIGAVVVFGGGGGGGSDQASKGTKTSSSVDISDLDDPKDTTTTEATTTTEPTTTTDDAPTTTLAPGQRVPISEGNIGWTMAAEPEVDNVDSDTGGTGQAWTAEADSTTTERVEITEIAQGTFDLDARIEEVAGQFDGTLSKIEDSHIAQAPGRTASFTGTLDGKPIVGYIVGARVGDYALVAMTYRESRDAEALYVDFLQLPGSFAINA
jgi:hypothetical protein